MLTSETRESALARVGRALADPTRCRILIRLLDGATYPGQLAARLGLSRSNVSNHLPCLRGCGLVLATYQGQAGPLRAGRPAPCAGAERARRELRCRPRQRDDQRVVTEPERQLAVAPDPHRRALLSARVRLLVAATTSYNVVEAVAAIWAGNAASSTALIGFGLDSVIEVASAAAVDAENRPGR